MGTIYGLVVVGDEICTTPWLWIVFDVFTSNLKYLGQLKDNRSKLYWKMIIQFSRNLVGLMKWRRL
jgi:hypothetical protein